MTPKEKAEELYSMYNSFGKLNDSEVKECALIAVDEIIDMVKHTPIEDIETDYWQEVKQEIEKL
jgi:hypothetical protein